MNWAVARRWLAPGRMLLQCGPLHMTIDARSGDQPVPGAVEAAEYAALRALADVAAHRALCVRWIGEVGAGEALPPVVAAMVRAVRGTDEPLITPMAAVAGSIADAAADAAFAAGATRVFCNNGGDIAVRLGPGESARVGLHRGLQERTVAGRLLVRAEDGIGGICTSGMGGRSLTCGIASAVTTLAVRAALADAAATLIANHVFVDHPAVRRLPAEQVDPETDIAGLPVTVSVGELPEEAWTAAGQHGLTEAERLMALGIIRGAVLHAGPWHGVTRENGGTAGWHMLQPDPAGAVWRSRTSAPW